MRKIFWHGEDNFAGRNSEMKKKESETEEEMEIQHQRMGLGYFPMEDRER